jgi:hypothetical protein
VNASPTAEPVVGMMRGGDSGAPVSHSAIAATAAAPPTPYATSASIARLCAVAFVAVAVIAFATLHALGGHVEIA